MIPVSLGRARTAVVRVTSTDQNGSVPRAVYDAHVATFGMSISADTPIGILGYGLGGGVSVFDMHEERKKRASETTRIIRIEERLVFLTILWVF